MVLVIMHVQVLRGSALLPPPPRERAAAVW